MWVSAALVAPYDGCMVPREPANNPPASESVAAQGVGSSGTSGEVEIGRVRDGLIIRGRAALPTVRPGTERNTFLATAANILEVSVDSLDLGAPIASRYGADELQIYECVQRAEDIWRVQLMPPTIPVPEFAAALKPFGTLAAIIAASESTAQTRRRE